MKLGKRILFALALFFAAISGPSPAFADEAEIKIQSNAEYKVHLKFFSKSYSRVWPAPPNVWVLDDYSTKTFSLACASGERICYGAWEVGGTGYWGVGRNGTSGCAACCITCGAGPYKTMVLDEADGD
ncbi:MAG: hypothetical protein KBD06_04105 [Candidatus Pacebacteria bacterium]|nr:hypothetical protein [Candidatus Paceibacterota bacterium]